MNKSAIFSLTMLVLLLLPFSAYSNQVDEIEKLQEEIINLEEKLSELQEQYQEVYSFIFENNISELPKLSNFGTLFNVSHSNMPVVIDGKTITIRDDASIYLGDSRLVDIVKSWVIAAQTNIPAQNAAISTAGPDFSLPSSTDVANLSLLTQAYETKADNSSNELEEIKKTVNSLKDNQSWSNEVFSECLDELSTQVMTLQGAINEGKNGGFSSTAYYETELTSPPVGGSISPISPPRSCLGSSFKVSKKSRLKKITLYCGNKSYLVSCGNLLIIPEDSYTQTRPTSVDVSNPTYPVYSFSEPIDLKPGVKYYICLIAKKVYTCKRFRGEGLYDMHPSATTSLPGNMNVKFYVSETELWSRIVIETQTDLAFDGAGLSVDGSKVITESSIASSVKKELANSSGAFNGSLTYDMFSSALKSKLVTTSGGTITGNLRVNSTLPTGNPLTVNGNSVLTVAGGNITGSLSVQGKDVITAAGGDVSWLRVKNRDVLTTQGGQTILGNITAKGTATVKDLVVNGSGDWQIGNSTNPSDVVIMNSKGRIYSKSGDLNLSGAKGFCTRSQSFFEFGDDTQCGTITISDEEGSSEKVAIPQLTKDAIILLTPLQQTLNPYWVEIDAADSSFVVKCSGSNEDLTNLKFNYLVVRK